jgi:hypothetical protein
MGAAPVACRGDTEFAIVLTPLQYLETIAAAGMGNIFPVAPTHRLRTANALPILLAHKGWLMPSRDQNPFCPVWLRSSLIGMTPLFIRLLRVLMNRLRLSKEVVKAGREPHLASLARVISKQGAVKVDIWHTIARRGQTRKSLSAVGVIGKI